MMKSFPQIVNNSCGGQIVKASYTTNSSIEVKGGGIYNDGTVNVKNALIASNDFSEPDSLTQRRQSTLCVTNTFPKAREQ